MNTQTIQKKDNNNLNLDKVENALLQGDLSKLSAEERKDYYRQVCQSVGLNPLTKPFEYITLNGELQLYAKRDAAEQLRKMNKVSITKLEKSKLGTIYTVTAHAKDGDGRTDVSTGAVDIDGLKGDRLANALMKAETKAKRRVTLSICGLGWLDETELDTIPDTQPADVDIETGEIQELPEQPSGSPKQSQDYQHNRGAYPPSGKHAEDGENPCVWSEVPGGYLEYVKDKDFGQLSIQARAEFARRQELESTAGDSTLEEKPEPSEDKHPSEIVWEIAHQCKWPEGYDATDIDEVMRATVNAYTDGSMEDPEAVSKDDWRMIYKALQDWEKGDATVDVDEDGALNLTPF